MDRLCLRQLGSLLPLLLAGCVVPAQLPAQTAPTDSPPPQAPPPLTAETLRRLRDVRVSARTEFETTAQYEARYRAAADAAFGGRSPLALIYPFVYQVDPAQITYDADTQEMAAPGTRSASFLEHTITFTDGLGDPCPFPRDPTWEDDPSQQGCVSLRRTAMALLRPGEIEMSLPRGAGSLKGWYAAGDTLIGIAYEQSRRWTKPYTAAGQRLRISGNDVSDIGLEHRFLVPLAVAPSVKSQLAMVLRFAPVYPYVREGVVTLPDPAAPERTLRLPLVLFVGDLQHLDLAHLETTRSYHSMSDEKPLR